MSTGTPALPNQSLVARGGRQLSGLVFDGEGKLFVCGSGKVFVEEGGSLVTYASTGGAPCGAAVDHLGSLYVADAAHAAVLQLRDDGTSQVIVREYEGTALRGPHSLLFSSSGDAFFTDAGPEGDTGLHDRGGSVFVVSGEGHNRLLRPLALRCLARPTGIALSPTEAALYVAEAAENRVLRFVQRAGAWHCAVFHTFAGRLGPACVVVDADRGGLVYVARPEAPELAERGIVSVLSPEGVLLREFEVPGPEVSGLALTPDGSHLCVCEATGNTVWRVRL